MIALNGKNCSRLLPPYNINLICSPSTYNISPKFLLFGEISAPFFFSFKLFVKLFGNSSLVNRKSNCQLIITLFGFFLWSYVKPFRLICDTWSKSRVVQIGSIWRLNFSRVIFHVLRNNTRTLRLSFFDCQISFAPATLLCLKPNSIFCSFSQNAQDRIREQLENVWTTTYSNLI
jgi:hypothetical protein